MRAAQFPSPTPRSTSFPTSPRPWPSASSSPSSTTIWPTQLPVRSAVCPTARCSAPAVTRSASTTTAARATTSSSRCGACRATPLRSMPLPADGMTAQVFMIHPIQIISPERTTKAQTPTSVETGSCSMRRCSAAQSFTPNCSSTVTTTPAPTARKPTCCAR